MTVTELDIVTDETTEYEPPKVAHIIRKEDQMKGYIEGTPVEALCGKVWVPTRDPEQYPVCEKCAEVLKGIQAGKTGKN